MLLQKSLQEFLSRKDIERITEQQYERSLRNFESYLTRPATIEDLTAITVNHWIKNLQATRSAVTCVNYKAGLLVLWNYLAESGRIAPYHQREIRQPRKQQKPVVAWTIEEIRLLLKACKSIDGCLNNGIAANDFLIAWILVGFETGLRPGDMRRITVDQVDIQKGTISITQHKTRTPHIARISPEAVKALKKLPLENVVFPLGKTGVRKWTQKLFKIASESGFIRRKKCGIGTLRKSHATEVFVSHGLAAAAQSLGHIGGTSTARSHYIDSRVTNVGILPTLTTPSTHGKNTKTSIG